jgi:hypothetical protein
MHRQKRYCVTVLAEKRQKTGDIGECFGRQRAMPIAEVLVASRSGIIGCEMGWLPSSPHGIAMCQNGRWKKRLRERTADEGYSDRR